MPLVTQTIKNLKGGISQQPDILRFPDQGETQVNAFSSEVEGLQKRPPSVHIKLLTDNYADKPLVRLINRDETERYYMLFPGSRGGPTGTTPRVWDLEGRPVSVETPHGGNYMLTTEPRDDLRLVTVADYTFVINRKVTVKALGDVTNPGYRKDGRCIINIKGGQYGRTYKVLVNSQSIATFKTPDGSEKEHAEKIDTQFITKELATQCATTLGSTWTVTTGPNWVMLAAPVGTPISALVTEDGFNNGLMTGVIFECQRFNMLPAQAPDGYIVNVTGDPGSGADDYFIKYDARKLVWVETVAPGIIHKLDPATMPHAMVRRADGVFELRQLSWQSRPSGDNDSSPMPSFVDNTINDVFFFRNRLGLLSGENVILSGSGKFFDFFPKSVVATGDSDPIDVAVSHTRVSTLNHAVPFAEELLLWSDQTQFVLRADGVLSSKSVKVDQSTEFESAIHARPVAAGRGVYFAAPRASFSSIRRYYAVQDVSAVKNAEDVTSHVPSYVPNGVFHLGSSTTENIVVVLTAGAPNKLFLYKYLYMDEQLAQQSWSHWDFGRGVRVFGAEMVGSKMYLMLSTEAGLYLESIEFTQNTKDVDYEPYRTYVDRKARLLGLTYTPDDNTTRASLAAVYGTIPAYGSYWVIDDLGRCLKFDPPQNGWHNQGGILEMPGDWSARTLVVGEAYTFTYQFSKFLIKVQDQMGIRSEDTGRLQIRRAWVNHNNSGAFTVTVCGKYTYTMTGKHMGDYVIGSPANDTDQFRFPIMANVDRCAVIVSSDNPTPLALIGGGWIGNYYKREQAI
ncbi:tail protein [Ralstonia phage RPSC1]|uniref:Putative tail tubular protein B n=1 Tax=Ralstonia phage RPSC1 TaxID=2041351 RepID=A0A2Z2U7S2_9CAUD|nr:tail protein [Ralstonia phage RPSC1]ATN92933.1 putative tail tubular protein B [Ralstonia phage RPSC1]